MTSLKKTILVLGATGQQGGAVTRRLLARGLRVRALVRNPHIEAALALKVQGAQLVRGDLNHPASVREAMEGVDGVFSVQTFLAEGGVAAEIRQGKVVADCARDAGIAHLVYSSVGGAERQSGIAHFESKWQIEQYIRTLELPATILRPVFFMNNFLHFGISKQPDETTTISLALHPETALQLLAVEDIGAFAALAFEHPNTFLFEHPNTFLGQAFELAGDELTPVQIAETFERVTGKRTRFVEVPIEQVRRFDAETATMFEWFNRHGYQADLATIRQQYPQVLTLETWLRQ